MKDATDAARLVKSSAPIQQIATAVHVIDIVAYHLVLCTRNGKCRCCTRHFVVGDCRSLTTVRIRRRCCRLRQHLVTRCKAAAQSAQQRGAASDATQIESDCVDVARLTKQLRSFVRSFVFVFRRVLICVFLVLFIDTPLHRRLNGFVVSIRLPTCFNVFVDFSIHTREILG
jgi:hypothetical protein